MLAQIDAISGIYTAFFPVFIYILLGTSRHISMGKLWYFLFDLYLLFSSTLNILFKNYYLSIAYQIF
jgi:hypothetical protein